MTQRDLDEIVLLALAFQLTPSPTHGGVFVRPPGISHESQDNRPFDAQESSADASSPTSMAWLASMRV